MASNKYDTPFEKAVVDVITLEYVGLYDTTVTFTGTLEQAIRHITYLQNG